MVDCMTKGVLHIEKHKMNEVRIIERNIKKDKGVWAFSGKGRDYTNFIDDRIKQLPSQRKVRKDAVAMVSVLVTTEKSFFDNLKNDSGTVKIKTFFRECYELLAARYGGYDGINIISCTVYKGDNWKMYFCFVPATADNRLSARSVLSPHEIRYLHRDFDKDIWTPWDVNEIELQKETVNLEKEKDKLEKEKADLEKENNQIRNENSDLNAENIRLDTENEKMKTHLAELEKKSNQIRNENSQWRLKNIRLRTKREKGTNAFSNLRDDFNKLKDEVAEAESELINIKSSLSQDQIQEKILKDDIANLVRERDALNLELKEMKTSLRFQHVLKEIAKK